MLKFIYCSTDTRSEALMKIKAGFLGTRVVNTNDEKDVKAAGKSASSSQQVHFWVCS